MKKKILLSVLSLCLIGILLMPMLFSCAGGGDSTEPQAPKDIMISDLSNYKIVIPQNAGAVVETLASTLKNNIEAKTGATGITVVNGGEPSECEILLGDTGRTESNEYLSTLRYKDYGYCIKGKKIVLGGFFQPNLQTLVAKFKADVIDTADTASGVFMKKDSTLAVAENYNTENMTLGGVPVKGMTLVYRADSAAAQAEVEDIAKAVGEKTGYGLFLRTDESSVEKNAPAMYLGIDGTYPSSLRSGDYYTDIVGNSIYLGYIDDAGLGMLKADIVERVKNADGTDIALEKDTFFTGFSAMSFNILYSQAGDAEAIARVVEVIKTQKPDSFGVQEASPAWMGKLKAALPEYGYRGDGRDGGASGEYNAVFFLKDKYEVVKTATKWLSNTPNQVSRFEETPYNRICTYVILEDILTGKRIIHMNTHFDHTLDSARAKQSLVLLGIIEEIQESNDLPIIVTGDFNSVVTSEAYKNIIASGLKDAYNVATVNNDKKTSTFHGFAEKPRENYRIDFCFINGSVRLYSYEVCDEKINGNYPSDHNPVLVKGVYY